jgi:hypothetical protein
MCDFALSSFASICVVVILRDSCLLPGQYCNKFINIWNIEVRRAVTICTDIVSQFRKIGANSQAGQAWVTIDLMSFFIEG